MLYKNKYKSESTRLQNHDYTSDGLYFITICTRLKEHYFGEIKNEIMVYSEIGEIAKSFWENIPGHFSLVELDEFIIMPNHIHGIIIINNATCDVNPTVETRRGASLHQRLFGPLQKNSISSIINHFKGNITKMSNQNKIPFAWQSRFYDHIIRDEKSLINVREYIRNNTTAWERDRNNVENLFM